VQAADKSDGCGLGWQVTSKTSFLGTTTRATTNMVVPPTFGMTSGTIGCARHSIAKAEMPAVNYAVTNYDSIKSEAASGKGEFISAFAEVMGCGASEARFIQKTKEGYKNLFNDKKQGLEMYNDVKEMIKSDGELSLSCQMA
jgi:hypothetical protein